MEIKPRNPNEKFLVFCEYKHLQDRDEFHIHTEMSKTFVHGIESTIGLKKKKKKKSRDCNCTCVHNRLCHHWPDDHG